MTRRGVMGVEIGRMEAGEIGRIREIDVSEEGEIVYRQAGEEVVTVVEAWTRLRWSVEECQRRAAGISERIDEEDAVVLGAFDDDLLVGMAVFRPHLSAGMSELAGLWVSRRHRRQRIASRLVYEVEELAREVGSTRLYVSATPSQAAVGFYRSRGFRPTPDVNPELYEREPEDVHMVLDLAADRTDTRA
jgi:GNAT superfamily N-acetyltransferase